MWRRERRDTWVVSLTIYGGTLHHVRGVQDTFAITRHIKFGGVQFADSREGRMSLSSDHVKGSDPVADSQEGICMMQRAEID